MPCRLGVEDEQLEEADEIVAVPLTGGVGLAEAELAGGLPTAGRAAVVDVDVDGGAGAEAPLGSVGKADLESSSLEVGELVAEYPEGDAVDERRPRSGSRTKPGLNRAHGRTEPLPGTNGGLWWNGTRLSHSSSACR